MSTWTCALIAHEGDISFVHHHALVMDLSWVPLHHLAPTQDPPVLGRRCRRWNIEEASSGARKWIDLQICPDLAVLATLGLLWLVFLLMKLLSLYTSDLLDKQDDGTNDVVIPKLEAVA